MKTKIYRTIKQIGIVVGSIFLLNAHPIKLTSSLIQYNPETTQLQIECRVFLDDFLNSIDSKTAKNINLDNLSNQDKKGIESYFKEYYVISINGKQFPLQYVASEVMEEYNICIFYFSQNITKPKKGDQLCVENKLFFEEFDFLQTNMVTVRFPSLTEEVYFEAMSTDYDLPINF
ncbi:hypothetical protein NBT05_09200 [Aquimarina sp. ERC-38]|uniref:DUF6702 family protein n=1 Tax=Aquimarina sp. ERC-38 TaxID=2949996 RepID=UPI0022476C20|nr:DUF6702 family protein [Aquimarina sp. ERC-38]UZO79147.1 hypothetical protein NBT05_09200 [Aquimarina sp. ERC-38]